MQQKGAESAWSLGPDSDFSTVSLLLIGEVTEQGALDLEAGGQKHYKASFY